MNNSRGSEAFKRVCSAGEVIERFQRTEELVIRAIASGLIKLAINVFVQKKRDRTKNDLGQALKFTQTGKSDKK